MGIRITKVTMLQPALHQRLVMELLLHQVTTVVLVETKGTKLKVRGMTNLNPLLLRILLEVDHMHKLLLNQLLHNNSNMVVNLHMELPVVVGRTQAIMHNHLHSTPKDKGILRLLQVMETQVLGTKCKSLCSTD